MDMTKITDVAMTTPALRMVAVCKGARTWQTRHGSLRLRWLDPKQCTPPHGISTNDYAFKRLVTSMWAHGWKGLGGSR